MSKTFFLLIVLALGVSAQPISFGVKGGVPLGDAFSVKSAVNSPQFTVGPMVELRLPLGLGVEADLLYNRYDFNAARLLNLATSSGSDASSVEIPIIFKKRFSAAPLVHPWLGAGPSFRRIMDVDFPGNVSFRPEKNGKGVAFSAGIELHLLLLKVSPEFRYTRWGKQDFIGGPTSFNASQNQAQILVGIAF